MSYLSIKQLAPSFRQGAILARVSRMWDYRGKTEDGDIQHVDLVLVDQEGTAIYAEIGHDDIETKKPLLAEGEIYVFKRFRVVNSKQSYRAVDFRYMISITCHTIVENCPVPTPTVPLYVYKLTKFSDLDSLSGETRSFIDVIGAITEVGAVETFYRKNETTPSKKRMVILTDTKHHEARIVIWGQRALQFEADRFCTMSEKKPVVAIFVGLLARPYKENTCLSANAAARWYVDVDVPEVRMFLKNFKTAVQPIPRVEPPVDADPPNRPLPEPELKPLAEIKATNPYDFPPQGFRCTITITKFDDTQQWWFASCNRCSKKCVLDADGSSYICNRCKCTSYKFKYKICYFAADNTVEADFIFFDDVGERLIGKDVRHLMRSSRGSNRVPADIAVQIGQKYQLTIKITSRAFHSVNYSLETKNIDFAYGKQPQLPRIHNLGDKNFADKDKAAINLGESSGDQKQQSKNPLHISPHSPTSQLPQITDGSTPPPVVSPVIPSSSLNDLLGDKTKHDPKDNTARRSLLSQLSDQEDEGDDPSQKDSDFDNDSSHQRFDDSKKTRRAGAKKPPVAKKAKKN